MPVSSRDELERLVRVIVHHRQYPSDDWDAATRRAAPSDSRTRENFREYMHIWKTFASKGGKKGAA